MYEKLIDVILDGELEGQIFMEEEEEIALKILRELEGTLVIRATSILEFCLKAIQYSKV